MPTSLYIRRAGKLIAIGNSRIELGFDASANGALVSIRDRRTNWQFRRHADAPRLLYRLALRNPRADEEWLDSGAARHFSWQRTVRNDSATLMLQTAHAGPAACRVTVEITLRADSPLSVWRMRVTGLPARFATAQLVCPVISGVLKAGAPVPGETLVEPRQGEGYLYRNPFPVVDNLPLMSGSGPEQPHVGVGRFGAVYPGWMAMQFLLYYNASAGLYLACHDSGMHVKRFACEPLATAERHPVLSIGHLPPHTPGGDATFEYDTVVGVFHGDWYAGADLYKAWARQQWWCRQKLADRDLARCLRTGFGVWQMSNFHIPKIKLNHSVRAIAAEVNALAKDAGVPLLALIFNFEKGGAWTGPIGFLPPREGAPAFKSAMRALRRAGNHGFVYMPGGNWYIAIDSYDPPFDSRKEFAKDGRPCALVNAQGKVPISSWYAGWHSAWLCPATPQVRKLTADLLLGALQHGCDVVQIDNFPCGSPQPCFSRAHGHPRGYGPWYTEAWRDILAAVRRRAKALNPDCIIATEGIAETYIPYLDMYDQRAGNMEYFGHRGETDPMHGETIPIFSYVYSGYIGAYLAAMPECNRPEVLYWTRALGKALTQGVVPSAGRYWPTPKASNPVTLAFYTKIVRAAVRDCWRYIMFGEMLRPPAIDVPRIAAAYVRLTGESLDYLLPKNRHVVTDAAVQHSAWRAADGTLGYIFVNVSREPVAFTARLKDHGAGWRRGDLDAIVDSRRRPLRRNARLPFAARLSMAPLSIHVIEVRAAQRGG
jgi:hypothetical protein